MDEEFETWLAWFMETEEFATNDHDEDLRAAWLEATRRANKLNADRINTLEAVLTEIALYAHDNSTGPAVPDHLWEIRRIAYDVL